MCHWLRQCRELKRVDTLARDMEAVHHQKNREIVILIDRIDEAWDGSNTAVYFLMALMHACVELSSHHDFVRPLLFVRENIFDRVKEIDNEYARLETWVVSLNWTEELLVEVSSAVCRPILIRSLPSVILGITSSHVPIASDLPPPESMREFCLDDINCHESLGGLLKHFERRAA